MTDVRAVFAFAFALALALVTSVLGGCTVFNDLDGLSGGAPKEVGDASTRGGDGVTLGNACGSGGICALAPPEGWTYAAVRFGEGADCPSGFSRGTDLVEIDNVPPATCNCACGAPTTPGSCTDGAVKLASGGGCKESDSVAASGACVAQATSGADAIRIIPPAPSQAPCPGTPGLAKPPAATVLPARSCAITPGRSFDGCEADRRCVPSPAGGYGLCIVQGGLAGALALLCPKGYSQRRVLGTMKDSRTCASCVCETTDSCVNPRLELFKSDCATTADLVLSPSAQCKEPGGTDTYTHARYKADRVAGAGCKVVKEEITGGAGLVDPVTVCCPSGS